MAQSVQRLVCKAGLVGLNSFDFLVEGQQFNLLEINPRPGASFDLFEVPGGSLFALHVAACQGRLPAEAPALPRARAGHIVYSERAIAAMPALHWPDWTADRPLPGTSVERWGPLCTVYASGNSAAQAKMLVEERATRILADVDAALP
jgi:predicted ATP-grasp superfamily ATP-dependent carboligase